MSILTHSNSKSTPVGDNLVPAAPAGLLKRKECWTLTWKGWLLLLFILVGISTLIVFRVHPFLAVTQRVNARFLVVEGWMDQDAMLGAVREFTNGSYERVITTGGPVRGAGPEHNPYSTSASIMAGQLKAAGLLPAVVQMVPSYIKDRDRTYSAALALRVWLDEHEPGITSVNLLTEGVHSRRSRLLFQKALGDKIDVGIVSIPSPEYDPAHWWRYSEGVKEVISEGAAYVYLRFFFHPDNK